MNKEHAEVIIIWLIVVLGIIACSLFVSCHVPLA